ncbi:hypothetical protein HDV02_005503 [Globomyces sp. JEL0801]|nr:hypothetical protein HDV02_005503 [Globomyces sp. JEL0801]
MVSINTPTRTVIVSHETIRNVRLILMSFNIPFELVDYILDIAKYWICEEWSIQRQLTNNLFTWQQYLLTDSLINHICYLTQISLIVKAEESVCLDHQRAIRKLMSQISFSWVEVGLIHSDGTQSKRVRVLNSIDAMKDTINEEFLFSKLQAVQIQEGDQIGVWVRTKYPGWKVGVGSASVRVYWKEKMQFNKQISVPDDIESNHNQ